MLSEPLPGALAAVMLLLCNWGVMSPPVSGIALHPLLQEQAFGKSVLGELCKLKTNGLVGALFNSAENELVNFAFFYSRSN